MNITILTLGSLKEKYWIEAEAEYLKRLSPYAKVEIKELKEESFTDKNNIEVIKEKEAQKLKNILEKKDTYIIALDSRGKQLTSTELAKHFTELFNNQISNITFVIGGPLGLDDSILELADFKLSLSNLTFTHQMVRTILLEQIYRSMMILNNRSYHY
ncbi:MAG: 23S rRNA (pseudouridine(1915)-N(3))-methyltransferase RlmH [Candidatus Magasanikiibacteriota bacterium]